MHPKEIEKVISLEPLKRYKYFIKKIADRELFYTLIDNKGLYAISEIDENNLFPLWSDKEYAELCRVSGWEGYSVQEHTLEDLNDILKLGYLLNIFPVYDRTGFVVDSEEFTRDLNEELENY